MFLSKGWGGQLWPTCSWRSLRAEKWKHLTVSAMAVVKEPAPFGEPALPLSQGLPGAQDYVAMGASLAELLLCPSLTAETALGPSRGWTEETMVNNISGPHARTALRSAASQGGRSHG